MIFGYSFFFFLFQVLLGCWVVAGGPSIYSFYLSHGPHTDTPSCFLCHLHLCLCDLLICFLPFWTIWSDLLFQLTAAQCSCAVYFCSAFLFTLRFSVEGVLY